MGLLKQYYGMSVLYYLREYFFPMGCGGCGEALFTRKDAYYGLCDTCRRLLEAAIMVEQRCSICGRPLVSERETCLSCREKGAVDNGMYNENITRMRIFFPYTGNFKKILGAYKFGKSLGIGNFFVNCLLKAPRDLGIEAYVPSAPGQTAWVPVPPRPGKIRKQGWDQIDYLAGLLEKTRKGSAYGIPVNRCLKRLPSRSQKELNREERSSNLKGRILCTKQPPKTAILFDDVITTGATLNACAAALLEAGAGKVYGVCLFFD